MKVVLSPDARAYAVAEATYLKERSPQAAEQFGAILKQVRRDLSRFPELGHVAEEIPVAGIRLLVVGSYLIDYEFQGPAIVILAIRHGR